MLNQHYQRVRELEKETALLLRSVKSVPTSELSNHPEWAERLESIRQELHSGSFFTVLVEAMTKGSLRQCWQEAHALLCEHGFHDHFHPDEEVSSEEFESTPPQSQSLPTPPAGVASEQLVAYLAELRKWLEAELTDLFDPLPEELQERLLPVGDRYHCPDFRQAVVVFELLQSIQGFAARWDRLRKGLASRWTTDTVLAIRFAAVEDILTSYEELISPSADDKVTRSGLVLFV